jgi:hypothetical protein
MRHDRPVRPVVPTTRFVMPAAAALACAVLAAAIWLGGAAGSGQVHVIRGDASIGGVRLGRTTAPEATALFAADGARHVRRAQNSCRAAWPRIGLTIDFGTIGSDPTNPCTGGTAFVVTISNRPAWRTAVGLRVGDTAARLRSLYPAATLHLRQQDRTGYWLVTRHACELGGGAAYPSLMARLVRGRVSAFVASVSICD